MSVMETCLFYVFTGVLCLLAGRYSEVSGKRIGLVLSAAILICVSGLRAYSVGIDTSSYQEGIEYFFVYNETPWNVSFAVGYGYFTKAVLTVWHSYSFLLFIQAVITNGLILARFWDYREVSSLTFMLFVYLCTFYLYTLNLICQSLAIAIVFYSTRYLDMGKPITCCIGIFLASTLHVSALIGVVVVILKYLRFKGLSARRACVQVIVLLAGFAVAMYAYGLLLERYSSYTDLSTSIGAMFFAQLLVFVGSILLSGYFSRPVENGGAPSLRSSLSEKAPRAVVLYVLSIFLSSTSYFIAPNAGRISYYFLLFGPVVYGAIAKRGGLSKECFLCSCLLVGWFVVYGFNVFILNDSGNILPYAFVWMS